MYYLECGADLKGRMADDREHSSFSELTTGTINWDKVLQDVQWLNMLAINPALNDNVAAVCMEANEAAVEKKITISMDFNFRSKLWKYGKQPQEVMPALVKHCDVVMGNIWLAETMLDIPVDEHIHEKKSKQAYLDHARKTSEEIIARFPKCKVVANTFRFDGNENHILYYTTLYVDGQLYASPEFTCKGVVDRSGSGDCFMGGLIYGLSKSLPPRIFWSMQQRQLLANYRKRVMPLTTMPLVL